MEIMCTIYEHLLVRNGLIIEQWLSPVIMEINLHVWIYFFCARFLS